MKSSSYFLVGLTGAVFSVLTSELRGDGETLGQGRYQFGVLAGQRGARGYVDGAGTTARFDNPSGIAVDGSGNVYVSESNVCTIRKISPDGVVTTWAGIAGEPGNQDGARLTAGFNTPTDLAVDGAGNVYVADSGNHTIRKIDSSGRVSTIAGTAGEAGYINGTKAVARLTRPHSLTVDDAGNVYFADTHGEFGAERPVRIVAPDGAVSNLVLSENAGLFDFNIQQWVRADRVGNLYVMFSHSGPFNDIVEIAKLTRGPDGTTYAPRMIFSDLIWHELPRIDVDGSGSLFIKDADGPLLIYAPGGESQARYSTGLADSSYEFAAGKSGELYLVGGIIRGGALEVGVFNAAAKGPVLLSQPSAQWTRIGDGAGFLVAAAGGPALSYQWYFNSVPISGATTRAYNIDKVQERDLGNYFVEVTDDDGSVTSRTAGLLVGTPPAIAPELFPVTVARGSTAVFRVSVPDATRYQWLRGGTAISGANSSSLVIRGANAADFGHYMVLIGGPAGLIASTEGTLQISDDPNFGHLTNLSVRARINPSDPSFTVGTVIGGATTGTKSLLVRAVGPSLAALGVMTPLTDPKLEVRAGLTVIAENNDWGGDATLRSITATVGAFPLAADSSKDAAVFDSRFVARDYTIAVSGAAGSTGDVLAELYDISGSFFISPFVSRLINMSVLRRVDAADTLTAGFVIGGNTARTVLVRAIGPGLAALNVPSPMPDPHIALFNATQIKIAENDNWGGDAQFRSISADVGAFSITDRNSRDAMLLITLPAGSYTAQVSSTGGGGSVLLEVYEVP